MILVLSLIAVLAISMISAVSAADITIDPKTPGGLKGAISSANNGDTILIKDGVYTGEANTNVEIRKDIKIKGIGSNLVFDGANRTRIFIVFGKVTVEKIKFTNGKYVVKSKAPKYGGAIATASKSFLTVKNCIFTNNQGSLRGGGINSEGSLTVENSIFTNNKAKFGGAIHIEDKNTGTINSCTFTNNQATNDRSFGLGGAINAFNVNLLVNKCTFTGNKGSSGGAVFTGEHLKKSNKITFTNCKFIKNTAVGYYVNQANGDGGAIASNYGKITISKTTFKDNKASRNGGAIRTNTYAPEDKLSITDSEFSKNFAAKKGGAIEVTLVGKVFTIINTKFSKNIAGKKYNAIQVSGTGKYTVTTKNVKISPKDGAKA